VITQPRSLVSHAQVGARCNDGDTPLHYASAQGNVDCLKPLVDAGADTEARDEDGESPLDVAGSARVKVLLRKLAEDKAAAGSDDDGAG
jgi:ankyrin repeat protein